MVLAADRNTKAAAYCITKIAAWIHDVMGYAYVNWCTTVKLQVYTDSALP